MTHVLVVDDNLDICTLLEHACHAEGYACSIAADGESAMKMFSETEFDILLLDLMLPGISGLQVCREIRNISNVPILIITAKGDEEDRIHGLDLGADDYITKPFSTREVIARIRAVLRRTAAITTDILRVGNTVLSQSEHTASINGQAVRFTKKEEALLSAMMRHPGRVFTRENLMETAWFYEDDLNDRAVDTHIKRLRSKLKQYGDAGFTLETVWGIGYCLKVNEHA